MSQDAFHASLCIDSACPQFGLPRMGNACCARILMTHNLFDDEDSLEMDMAEEERRDGV